MRGPRRWSAPAPILVAAMLTARSAAAAQDVGAGPIILGIEGVRAATFGGALHGVRAPDATFSSPGLVGVTGGTAVAVSRYGGASTSGLIVSSDMVGRVGLAVGVRWLEFGLPDVVGALQVGQLVADFPNSATDLAATAAVSYPIKGVRTGVSVTYAEERSQGTYMAGLVFDAGAFKDLGRVEVGLSAQNLGPSLDDDRLRYDALPTRIGVGGAVPAVMVGTFFDLAATAMVGWERDLGLAAGGGMELSYVPLEGYAVAVRAGLRRVRTDDQPHPWPVAFGASVAVDRFRFDLSSEPSRGGGTVHRFGVRIQ